MSLMRRQPGEPGTTCPYCGIDDEDSNFTFEGDREAATKFVEWAGLKDAADFIGSALDDMARRINRGRGAITARYTAGRQEPKPFVWREDLLRNLNCDICGRAYGVYAIGLFCPDCGAKNAHVHFRREMELIRKQIEIATSPHDEELSCRLLGNAHEDVLTALETYLKTMFRFLVRCRVPERYDELCSKKALGNSFQNVERGRRQYDQIGMDPYLALSSDDVETMRLNIEKRHVVGHNLSMADESYVKTDESGQAGQTIRILAEDIDKFAELCGTVIQEVENAQEFLP